MNRDDIRQIIKEYLESNEGNMDMHGLIPDGAADTEAMADKITEKLCENMLIQEKILSYYKNNCELKEDMTEFDKGYLKALTDIMLKNPLKEKEV